MSEFLSIDFPALLATIFACLSCALLGNYLVLRKLSLMGDAISHSVLPGIVVAFLVTSQRGSLPIFIGATIAGVLSSILIEFIRKLGRVETGASMGVVFSIFFALGIVLIEQAADRNIDLDADCLLHGQLESIFWYPPEILFSLDSLYLLPKEVYESLVTFLLVVCFIFFFYKELKISSFDPELSNALGFSSGVMYQLLMFLVAVCVVASFRIVGSILVISMLICPAATARFYTDKLSTQIWVSAFFAILFSCLGYFLGGFGPMYIGYQHSLSISGMIAVVSGLILFISIFIAPRYGIISKEYRRRNIALIVREDDILALLYRSNERGYEVNLDFIKSAFIGDLLTNKALKSLKKSSCIDLFDKNVELLDKVRASKVVRSHRLWETYLVERANFSADHVHSVAETLEHFGNVEEELDAKVDPHGSKIP